MAIKKDKEIQFKKLPLQELQATIQTSYEQSIARAITAKKSEDKSRERSALSVLGSIREYLAELQKLKRESKPVEITELEKDSHYIINGKEVYKDSNGNWIGKQILNQGELKAFFEYMYGRLSIGE
jgi:hypothetical protein